MGACDEDLILPVKSAAGAPTNELRLSKHGYDSVRGDIYLDPICLKFIETEQFQRLRELKQLGVTQMVYPGAMQTVERLTTFQGMVELDTDRYDLQTVRRAGLLHGPFNQTFEREFLPRAISGCAWSQELMGVNMIGHINVHAQILKTVKGNAEKRLLYGINVNKFDSLVRDSRACGLRCNFLPYNSYLHFCNEYVVPKHKAYSTLVESCTAGKRKREHASDGERADARQEELDRMVFCRKRSEVLRENPALYYKPKSVSNKLAENLVGTERFGYLMDSKADRRSEIGLSDTKGTMALFWKPIPLEEDCYVSKAKTAKRNTQVAGFIRHQLGHSLCWAYTLCDLISASLVLHGFEDDFKPLCPWYLCSNVRPDILERNLGEHPPNTNLKSRSVHSCYGLGPEQALRYVQRKGIPEEKVATFNCNLKRPEDSKEKFHHITRIFRYPTMERALKRLKTHPVHARLMLYEGWTEKEIYRGPKKEGAKILDAHGVLMLSCEKKDGEMVVCCKSSNDGYIYVSLEVMVMVFATDKESVSHKKTQYLLSDFLSVDMGAGPKGLQFKELPNRTKKNLKFEVDLKYYDGKTLTPGFESDEESTAPAPGCRCALSTGKEDATNSGTVKKALGVAGLEKSQIVLSGGSTIIPKVQQLLKDGKEPIEDLGHGPFSHMFEREFLPRVISDCNWSHESMSVTMIDNDVDAQMLQRAKDMILASTKDFELNNLQSNAEKRFLYDIVANGRNGIDVDKFDYLVRDSRARGLGCNFQFQRLTETMRVMDNEICYRAKEYRNVFATRADLHRTVYTHPRVKAIELMIADAMVKANDHLGISSYIDDPSEYWKLDETILRTIENSSRPELAEARERQLYQFCNEYAVPKDKMDHLKAVTAQDITCSQKHSSLTLKEEDIAVANVKIDLARGRENPPECIRIFKDYESEEKFVIPEERVSHLFPSTFQDTSDSQGLC